MHETTTVGVALQIAQALPTAMLPCPLCSAQVKAGNLQHHLGRAHDHTADGCAAGRPLRVSGSNHRIRRPLTALALAWLFGEIVWVALTGPPTDRSVTILLVALGVAWIPAVAAFCHCFRAHLLLEAGSVCLRWGLGRESVALPAQLVAGRLIERRIDAGAHQQVDNPPNHDEVIGVYVQLQAAGSTITVGSRNSAALGKHWASKGWVAGRRRRRCDLLVDRSAMVALEYHLAGHGMLAPHGA